MFFSRAFSPHIGDPGEKSLYDGSDVSLGRDDFMSDV